mgnify:FL=1|tara:strand:+ start:343 stop:630 length:288 start_codon:yes stop_codon:yes gene_type:complete
MAFKGTTPSDLWLKYSVEGGRRLMELDLIIAAEINDKIAEATKDVKDTKGMVARRDQKRHQRKLLSNNNELLGILRDSGVPVVESKSGENLNDRD